MPSIFESLGGPKLGTITPFAKVTQTPNKTDDVTVNAISGTIETANTAIQHDTANRIKFTVKNSFVNRGDVIILNHSEGDPSDSGYNHGSVYVVQACAVVDGEFLIQISNIGTQTHNDRLFINFTVQKAVSHS